MWKQICTLSTYPKPDTLNPGFSISIPTPYTKRILKPLVYSVGIPTLYTKGFSTERPLTLN